MVSFAEFAQRHSAACSAQQQGQVAPPIATLHQRPCPFSRGGGVRFVKTPFQSPREGDAPSAAPRHWRLRRVIGHWREYARHWEMYKGSFFAFDPICDA
jgi:hypothetical protein